ncbi:hypothetical protein BDV26DRAFT_192757 [Aspergillus bertholletiae]|uniref:Uncharacterized protein n=1 Tax=Aspergillus bertholletiae TaxID=1226010 RepID=A0A5N7B900_9EURO|nr:hypothetical protein BDV26DRAFT_192757 [Aspergillus bertholletiae]
MSARSAVLTGHWIVQWGWMGTRRLRRGAYLGFCFADTEFNYRRQKMLHPKPTPVCRNKFEQFLETKSLLCESFLRSPQSVTWLGSNAAEQGALGSMSHLMRCQTKCDALANDARSSIASTGKTRGKKKKKKKKSYAV